MINIEVYWIFHRKNIFLTSLLIRQIIMQSHCSPIKYMMYLRCFIGHFADWTLMVAGLAGSIWGGLVDVNYICHPSVLCPNRHRSIIDPPYCSITSLFCISLLSVDICARLTEHFAQIIIAFVWHGRDLEKHVSLRYDQARLSLTFVWLLYLRLQKRIFFPNHVGPCFCRD